jgi:hypothetical protein
MLSAARLLPAAHRYIIVGGALCSGRSQNNNSYNYITKKDYTIHTITICFDVIDRFDGK